MKCKVEWCDRKVRANGYCNAHSQRLALGKDMSAPLRVTVRRQPGAICSVEGCDRNAEKTQYCGMHYQRFKANGDPTLVKPRGFPKLDAETRLKRWLDVRGEDECWNWTGATDWRGYGRMGRTPEGEQLPHRVAYKLWNGPLSAGDCVLHKCDNPRCCNPNHLFVGDIATNNLDMRLKGRSKPFGGKSSFFGARKKGFLSQEDVLCIRDRNNSMKSLATRYNISISMVSLIRARKCYSNID